MGRGQGNQERGPRGRGNEDGERGGSPSAGAAVPDVFELSRGNAAPPGFIDRGRAANREPAEPPVLEEKPPENDPELPYVEQPGGETEPAPLPYPEPEPPAAEVETAPPPYPTPAPPPEPVAEVEPAPPVYPEPAPPPLPREERTSAVDDGGGSDPVVISFGEPGGNDGTITLTGTGDEAPGEEQDNAVITFTDDGASDGGQGGEPLFTISDRDDDQEVVTIVIDEGD